MSYLWKGIMKAVGSKYYPFWEAICSGGSDVNGIMKLAGSKYYPEAQAHGICDEKAGIMVEHNDKYYPQIELNDEESCCAGESCGECDELLWDSGETPKKIQVIVSGVDWETSGCGEADPNGTYILTQETEPSGEVIYPCRWSGASGIFAIFYQAYSTWPCQPHGMSSCVHIYSEKSYGAVAHNWYFRNCANYCGLEGMTYNNLDIAVTDCCGGDRVGGCDFGAWKAIPSAAFGGQAVVSWPI